MAVDSNKLCDVLLGVFLPPVLVFMKRGCGCSLLISLILCFLVIGWPAAVIHAFHVAGYHDICSNVLCVFLPPVAAFLRFGCKCEFWISLVLLILVYIPSVIYTYYVTW